MKLDVDILVEAFIYILQTEKLTSTGLNHKILLQKMYLSAVTKFAFTFFWESTF